MMSRMKKIIPIILIGALVAALFAGCTNPFSILFGKRVSEADAKAMKGTWELVAGGTAGAIKTAAELGKTQSFVFNDNGKAIYTTDGKQDEYKWEKYDNSVTLTKSGDKNGSDGFTITLDGDSFKLYQNELGQNLELIFARKGTAAMDPSKYVTAQQPAPAPQAPATPSTPATNTQPATSGVSADSLKGTYDFTERLYNGKWWSAEDSELFDCYLTLRNDGAFVLSTGYDTKTGIYEWDGSTLYLATSATASDVMNTKVEGNTIIVYNPMPGNPSVEALKFKKR